MEEQIHRLIKEDKLGRNEIIKIVGCTVNEYAMSLQRYIFSRTERDQMLGDDKIDIRYLDKDELNGYGQSFRALFENFD